MSWSCPFQAVQPPPPPPPIMSLTFFHVCPVLSLRVISLHLPSCRLVSLCVVSISFPLRSPCFHFCPLHVPFSSPWFPFRVPLLSCHVDFPFPPRVFPDFRQKEAGTPNQQRAGRGNRAWGPCFATPAPRRRGLVERHQIAVRGGGGCVIDVSRARTKGGVILYPLLGIQHAEQCRRISPKAAIWHYLALNLAMGQHPVPPANIPIPTQIGSNMSGEFTYQPKWRIPKRF